MAESNSETHNCKRLFFRAEVYEIGKEKKKTAPQRAQPTFFLGPVPLRAAKLPAWPPCGWLTSTCLYAAFENTQKFVLIRKMAVFGDHEPNTWKTGTKINGFQREESMKRLPSEGSNTKTHEPEVLVPQSSHYIIHSFTWISKPSTDYCSLRRCTQFPTAHKGTKRSPG